MKKIQCLICGKEMEKLAVGWFGCLPCGFGIGEDSAVTRYYFQSSRGGPITMDGWKTIPEGVLFVASNEEL